MRIIQMYSSRPIVGQSFKGVKRVTVPKQSLSLREIVRRFVRRESLPMSKEGFYETRFGDLEKLAGLDMYEQIEHANWLKEKIAEFNDREKVRVDQEAVDAKAKADEEFKAKVEAEVLARTGSKVPPA